MRKLLVIIILLIASGCSSSEDTLETPKANYSSTTISGYVTAVDDGEFLAVDHQPKYKAEREGGLIDAYWFSSKEKVEGVEVGDYVHAWGSAEFLSYPGRTGLTNIIIEEQDEKKTDLTIKQVIQQAIGELQSVTGERYYPPILAGIHYEQQKDNWIVYFQNKNKNKNESDIKIQIKDA
ncbi:MAG: DUF3221 domain-containing protein [Lysinibacillus sp.]